jgi:glucose-1-phosphate cytidylyltransferase
MTKVVLLCGGKGSRLGEITEGKIPKPMVQIGNKPILWHLMKCFSQQGFSDFVICAGHLSDVIKSYFLNLHLSSSDIKVDTATGVASYLKNGVPAGWNVLISDTGNDTMTAGRIARIAKYLELKGEFFLTYGDGLSDVNLKQLLAFHHSHGRLATITGVLPPGRFGELHIEGDKVINITEKPGHSDRFINGGYMVLNRSFVDRYCQIEGADNTMLEREPLEKAAADGELMVFRHLGFWQCMDTARDWELLDSLARAKTVPWK